MELSDLRVFRMVVQAGGVTRAAERLHRVQSNVTTRVKKLEHDLGVALFERQGNSLRLTSAGTLLVTYADEMLALAERARDAVQEKTPRGLLRIGAMESTAAVRLPGPLAKLCARYPDMNVELTTGPSRPLTQQVLAGELDAAFIAGHVVDPRLETLPTFEERLVIVAGANHAPIRRPADVKTRGVLTFRNGCNYRQRVEEWFAAEGVPIERIVELASYHAILGCAAAGMGVAMVPLSVLDAYSERAQLSVHPLDEACSSVRTTLIWRKTVSRLKIMALAEFVVPEGIGGAIVATRIDAQAACQTVSTAA